MLDPPAAFGGQNGGVAVLTNGTSLGNNVADGSKQQSHRQIFGAQLVDALAALYESRQLSDLVLISSDGAEEHAHRLVLHMRTGGQAAVSKDRVDSSLSASALRAWLRWLYTDALAAETEEEGTLCALADQAAQWACVAGLQTRCISALQARLCAANCVPLFAWAERRSHSALRDQAAAVAAAHWGRLSSAELDALSAPLLLALLKRKESGGQLACAILKLGREDALALYLAEKADSIVLELNASGRPADACPLAVALSLGHFSMAQRLVEERADVATKLADDNTLLHHFVVQSNALVACWLLERGADWRAKNKFGATPLHAFAAEPASSSAQNDEMLAFLTTHRAELPVLETDQDGRTPLHYAAGKDNLPLVELLLQCPDVQVDARDKLGHTPLYAALLGRCSSDLKAAVALAAAGADVDAKDAKGVPMLHSYAGHSDVAIFLLARGADPNAVTAEDEKDESGVEMAAGTTALMRVLLQKEKEHCTPEVVKALVEKGARTLDADRLGRNAIHALVLGSTGGQDREIVAELLGNGLKGRPQGAIDTPDADGRTALHLAVEKGDWKLAEALKTAGADVDRERQDGMTSLTKAIRDEDDDRAIRLIHLGANPATRMHDENANDPFEESEISALFAAIRSKRMPRTVAAIAGSGVSLDEADEKTGFPPIYTALKNACWTNAATLHSAGASLAVSHIPSGRSMLAVLLDDDDDDAEKAEQNEEEKEEEGGGDKAGRSSTTKAAVWLIEHGAPLNQTAQKQQQQLLLQDPQELKQQQPPVLHAAVHRKKMDVLEALCARQDVDLLKQDADGRTAAHVAVRQRRFDALQLLLDAAAQKSEKTGGANGLLAVRDRHGLTPFDQAVAANDHQAAALMAAREPAVLAAANPRGETALHAAARRGHLEGLLCLLAAGADAKRRVSDARLSTALHLAAQYQGDPLVVRHLLLAGCEVDAQTDAGETALHLAAGSNTTTAIATTNSAQSPASSSLSSGSASANSSPDTMTRGHERNGANGRRSASTNGGGAAAIVACLLESGANVTAVDKRNATALHHALAQGGGRDEAVVRALIAAGAPLGAKDVRGRTPLHLLAADATAETSATLAPLLVAAADDEALETRDASGTTPLLACYAAGRATACRVLLARRVSLAQPNAEGMHVFNYPTPTKQLLFALLESLEAEPRWVTEGELCSDCEQRFGLTTRRHHCRHCGRLVCARCSETQMPIVKFGEEKRVRVCTTCRDVLSVGAANNPFY